MKKILLTALAVSALVTPSFAQERAAGGAMETQMTWTTLMNMAKDSKTVSDAAADLATKAKKKADTAFDNADTALTNAKKAQTTADAAKTTGDLLKACSRTQTFYDPTNTIADKQTGCVGSDGLLAGSRTQTTGKAKSQVLEVTPRNNMMIHASCSQTVVCMASANLKLFIGQKDGSWKKLDDDSIYGGGSCNDNRGLSASSSLSADYYVQNDVIYEGSMVVTPNGVRVAGKNKLMNLSNWNGKFKFEDCGGTLTTLTY